MHKLFATLAATGALTISALAIASPANAAAQCEPWAGPSYMKAYTCGPSDSQPYGQSQAWEVPGYYGDCVTIKRLWNNQWTPWTSSCNEQPQTATIVRTPDGAVAKWTRAYVTNADGSNFTACFHTSTSGGYTGCDTWGEVWFTVMCNGVPQNPYANGSCTWSLPPVIFMQP